MKARCEYCELQVAFGHAQAPAECIDQAGAANFMADVSRPLLPWCGSLTHIVQQSGKPHSGITAEFTGALQRQQAMYTGVDFRMVFFRLRHSKQPVEFR